MNKILLNVWVPCFLGICGIVITFVGCNNESYVSDELPTGQHHYTTELDRDLQNFAIKHSDMMSNILNRKFTLDGKIRANSEYSSSEVFDELDDNIERINQKYDLYSDLPDEKRKPCMSEDSVIMMQMDYDMFLLYIKENKSTEFYDIYKDAVDRGYLNVTADDVISNKKLYLNEKYSLLLALPASEQTTSYGMPWIKTRTEGSDNDKCLESFYDDRRSCGISFGVACVLSCTGGVFIAGVGVVVASIELDNCLDRARDTYINCQKLADR